MKKVLSMVLLLSLILTVSTNVFAATSASDFTFDSATGTIISYNGSASSVDIPSTISSVSVKEIAKNAFTGKATVTSVNIPETVTKIDPKAFYDVENLTQITVNANNPYFTGDAGVLFDKNKKMLIKYPESKTSTTYSIPTTVERIGNFAFANALNLTGTSAVTFPENLKYIGYEAFYNCQNIKRFAIKSGTTDIKENAFEKCSSLLAITVSSSNPNYSAVSNVLYSKDKTVLIKYPEGNATANVSIGTTVKEIAPRAFANSQNIQKITFLNSATVIGYGAFENCQNLEEVILAEGVKYIPSGAFANAAGLLRITIPNTVTAIGKEAFMNCVSLTSIEIPSSVTSIGENAFNGCINLVTAKFPETLKEISYRSFYGCESLSNLVIKHGITTLGESAFAGATSLEEVTIPKTVTSIGDYTFNKCNLLTLGVLDASYAKDYASSNSLVYVTVKPREVVMGENNLSVTGNIITGSVLFKAVNNIEDTSIYAVFGIYQGGRLLDVQGKNVNLTWGKNDVPFTDILATSSMQGDITIKVLSWNLLSGMESVIDPFETEI